MTNQNHNGPDWKVILEAFDLTEAVMTAERLQGLGIPAVVDRQGTEAGFGLMRFGPLGRAKVLVPEAYYERALAVLGVDAPAEADDFEAEEDYSLDDDDSGSDDDFGDDGDDDNGIEPPVIYHGFTLN